MIVLREDGDRDDHEWAEASRFLLTETAASVIYARHIDQWEQPTNDDAWPEFYERWIKSRVGRAHFERRSHFSIRNRSKTRNAEQTEWHTPLRRP